MLAEYRWTTALVFLHIVLILAGFFILVAAFGFPDILRASAQDRLAQYLSVYGTIAPAYYLMALTGLTQVALAVMFYRILTPRDSTLALLAIVFGVVGGIAQFCGFIRWTIVIPYLAEAMISANGMEDRIWTIGLAEGLLNRYGGMVIGEHLGFIGQGLWSIFVGLAILHRPLLSKAYGLLGIVLGFGVLLAGLEQLGGPFEALGMISTQATALWLGWILLLGVSLLRTKRDETGPRFGVGSGALMISVLAIFFALTLT